MSRIVGGFLVLGLGLSVVAAADPGQERQISPAEQYQALLKAQQLASSAGRVLTDEERLQFIGQTFRRWNEIAVEFVKLAEKYPKDPVAVDALIRAVWQVNSTPWPVELAGPDDARAKSLALLQRDHIQSEKLGPLCDRVSYGFASDYETFLRAALEKNPHRGVKAQAYVGLAHFLTNRRQRLDLINGQPELTKGFAGLFGKAYLEELSRQDPARAASEAEALLERAARDFGDVKVPDGGTVGEKAEAGLFEIRNLVVGKKAPEMEGKDQDGRQFKLSDYRGKVVLGDFWSEY
jgi:hypothetical protein